MAVSHSEYAPSVAAVPPASIRRWRRARLVVVALVALLVLVAAILGGVGWYFSDQLLRVTHAQKPYTLHVTAVGVNTITMRADHIQAWNVDPTAYTAALTTFLTRELR